MSWAVSDARLQGGLKREEALTADGVVRAGRAPGWRSLVGESLEKASASCRTPSASFSWRNEHQLLPEWDWSVTSGKQSIKEGVSGKGAGCACPRCLVPASCRWCPGSESSAVLRDLHPPPAPFQSGTPQTAAEFSQLSGGSASVGLSAQSCCCLFETHFCLLSSVQNRGKSAQDRVFPPLFCYSRICTVWSLHRPSSLDPLTCFPELFF